MASVSTGLVSFSKHLREDSEGGTRNTDPKKREENKKNEANVFIFKKGS